MERAGNRFAAGAAKIAPVAAVTLIAAVAAFAVVSAAAAFGSAIASAIAVFTVIYFFRQSKTVPLLTHKKTARCPRTVIFYLAYSTLLNSRITFTLI